MDREYDVVGGYIPTLVQHLENTRSCLGSYTESQANDNGEEIAQGCAHGHSGWTPAEHNALFRALSVHSRWRPDLIAACIPSRTEWEVWMYLKALEEGSTAFKVAARRCGQDTELSSDSLCSRSPGSDMDEEDLDLDLDLPDVHSEPALEVSQAWIEAEERMAAWIVRQEHLMSVVGEESVASLPQKPKRGRPRDSRKGRRARSRRAQQGQAISDEDDHSISPVHRSLAHSTRDPSASLARKREVLMSRLEVPHLLVLDNILREGEESTKEKSRSRDCSVTPEVSVYSPQSRRRIQKRLYMRQRRASLHEDDGTFKSAPDRGTERLKPGKKAKPERNEIPAVSTTVRCSEAPSDAEMEVAENISKRGKRGLTLPYKLKAQFSELGVDATYLCNQSMNMLNMGALGRLMGLHSCLEHGKGEEYESSMAQSIDARLIQHLQAALASFVTDTIHQAIVWREREIRLKRRSRAWRQGDQLTIGAVKHAVEVVGARYHSRKEYFRSLEATRHQTERSSAAANTSDETNPDDDPGVEAADQPPALSLHRSVYTPIIYPPPAWKMGTLDCLSRTYEGEATRMRRGPSAETDEEEMMSDETDAEALEAELEEEEEADVRDMRLGEVEEEALWASVRLI